MSILRNVYYDIKPLIPRKLQLAIRRQAVHRIRAQNENRWPIFADASRPPDRWEGWPDNKKFAFVLTHDVDTSKGENRCLQLAALDCRLGFRSAFYFVAARARETSIVHPELQTQQFEIGVHGLFHDGKLFRSRDHFDRRAAIINRYLKKWGAVGFRAPAVHHVLEWIHDLNILYDASTFDVDPFEPQPDGMRTIFPFRVIDHVTGKSYIELPYTLAQDFTLFILMKEKTIDIWKRKIDWIAQMGGMALVITHPDYMSFEGLRPADDEYPAEYYEEFLTYVRDTYSGQYWHALPRAIASFWLQR